MKLLVAIVILVAAYACTEARASAERLRVEFWQDADSARYVLSWVAGPRGSRQRATAYYETEILSLGVAVASDTTASLNDTLAVAYPPFDSIMPLLARVRAVDERGLSGDWLEQVMLDLVSPVLPPSRPESLRVDTLGVDLIAIFLRPTIVTMVTEGTTIQFCTFYVLEDGSTGLTTNSRGIPRCDELYTRWLTERSV